MAVFYPFLDGESHELPEQAPEAYRLIAYFGALGEADLTPGPALDTARRDDIGGVLTLMGLDSEAMPPQAGGAGRPVRMAWLESDAAQGVTPEIVFALEDEAARRFLLDLQAGVALLKALRPGYAGGCLLQMIEPLG